MLRFNKARFRSVGKAVGLGLAFFLAGLAGLSTSQKADARIVEKTSALPPPQLKLEWRVLDDYVAPATPQGRSRVRFTLTNTGPNPLPAGGWSLYFTTISGAATAPDVRDAQVIHVAGSLYAVRPNAPQALAPGQSISLDFDQTEFMVKTEKAPNGPYIVFDQNPQGATNIAEYIRAEIPRHLIIHGIGKHVGETVDLEDNPEAIFKANAEIQDIEVKDLPPVLPRPVGFTYGAGNVNLNHLRLIVPKALRSEGAFARSLFKLSRRVRGRAGVPLRLQLKKIEDQTSADAYRLSISAKDGVTITGNSPSGVFYGLQSLRQIRGACGQDGADCQVRTQEIVDAPRFAYRGLMVDVARNFQSKSEIYALINLMARFKLNQLHLHLVDDEGWRIAIKGLPELTEFGARRGAGSYEAAYLPAAYGSGGDAHDAHGSGFYTQADYVEILRFAKAQHITVIPEIEMPGHSRAAVKAMAARYARLTHQKSHHAADYLLTDPEDKSVYRSAQQYTDNVIDPGLESSYRFIDKVTRQIIQLHKRAGQPLTYFHLGADELANGAWEKSPATNAAMSRLGLKALPDMWDYFYDRINNGLVAHGVRLAGWEELGERKTRLANRTDMQPSAHFQDRKPLLYVWNNLDDSDDLAYKLANKGYDIILAPVTNLYFDMAHSRDVREPGHNWAGYTDLKDVWGLNPFAKVANTATITKTQLSDEGKARIKGLEATLFSETMREPSRIDYMLMPRMLGLAERAWAAEPDWARQADNVAQQKDWSIFVNQIGKQILPQLDAELPALNYRIPPPGLHVEAGQVKANSLIPGMVIRYSADGTPPSLQSPVLNGTTTISGPVNAALFNRNGRAGRVITIKP